MWRNDEMTSKVLSVPQMWAKEGLCSEGSIAMVLKYYGYEPPDLETIRVEIKDYIWDAVPFLRKYLKTSEYVMHSPISELKASIDKGNPVLIRIEPVGQEGGHTVVLTGYDDKRDVFYINDPAYKKANAEVPQSQLIHEWNRALRGAVIVYGKKEQGDGLVPFGYPNLFPKTPDEIRSLIHELHQVEGMELEDVLITLKSQGIDDATARKYIMMEMRFHPEPTKAHSKYDQRLPKEEREQIAKALKGMETTQKQVEGIVGEVGRFMERKVFSEEMELVMSVEDFYRKYKPMKNHLNPNMGEDFNPCNDKEMEFVSKQDDHHIWTQISAPGSAVELVSGYQRMDALSYIVTEVPWANETIIRFSAQANDYANFNLYIHTIHKAPARVKEAWARISGNKSNVADFTMVDEWMDYIEENFEMDDPESEARASWDRIVRTSRPHDGRDWQGAKGPETFPGMKVTIKCRYCGNKTKVRAGWNTYSCFGCGHIYERGKGEQPEIIKNGSDGMTPPPWRQGKLEVTERSVVPLDKGQMILLTKELERVIPQLYSTEGISLDEKRLVAKFFTPDSNWTWYVAEGSWIDDEGVPSLKSGKAPVDYLFFGWVHGFEKEWGNFVLSELMTAKGPMGLHIERDKFWTPKKAKEIGDQRNMPSFPPQGWPLGDQRDVPVVVDIKKYKFGSVQWQDAMIQNITSKIEAKVPLDTAEKAFVHIQLEHNLRLKIDQGIPLTSHEKTIWDEIKKGTFKSPFDQRDQVCPHCKRILQYQGLYGGRVTQYVCPQCGYVKPGDQRSAYGSGQDPDEAIKKIIQEALTMGMDAELAMTKNGQRVTLLLAQSGQYRTALYPDLYSDDAPEWIYNELKDLLGHGNTGQTVEDVMGIIEDIRAKGYTVQRMDTDLGGVGVQDTDAAVKGPVGQVLRKYPTLETEMGYPVEAFVNRAYADINQIGQQIYEKLRIFRPIPRPPSDTRKPQAIYKDMENELEQTWLALYKGDWMGAERHSSVFIGLRTALTEQEWELWLSHGHNQEAFNKVLGKMVSPIAEGEFQPLFLKQEEREVLAGKTGAEQEEVLRTYIHQTKAMFDSGDYVQVDKNLAWLSETYNMMGRTGQLRFKSIYYKDMTVWEDIIKGMKELGPGDHRVYVGKQDYIVGIERQPQYKSVPLVPGITMKVPVTGTEMTIAKEKQYMDIFSRYSNKSRWKDPPTPVECENEAEAELIADVFEYYLGGAEINQTPEGKIVVTSQGYYHYIGS